MRARRLLLAALAGAVLAVGLMPPAGASYVQETDFTSVAPNPSGTGWWTQTDYRGVATGGGAPSYGTTSGRVQGTIVATPTGGGY